MRLEDPERAQTVVADYVAVLERHISQKEHPAPLASLPHPKETIRRSIQACTVSLVSTGQMTADLRDFLQVAYVSLADYQPDDLIQLLADFDAASRDLGAQDGPTRERARSAAWSRLSTTGSLVAKVAQSIADESAALRSEFDEFCKWAVRTTAGRKDSHEHPERIPPAIQDGATTRS